MVYVLIIAIIVTSGYVGNNIAQKYINRVNFYKNIIKFADFLLLNINGYNDNIISIINRYEDDNNCLQLKKLSFLSKSETEILECVSNMFSYKCLSQKELKEIVEFYFLLGKFNTASQLHYITSYKNLFEHEYNDAVLAQKQKGNISFKISISIGVLICIFII